MSVRAVGVSDTKVYIKCAGPRDRRVCEVKGIWELGVEGIGEVVLCVDGS